MIGSLYVFILHIEPLLVVSSRGVLLSAVPTVDMKIRRIPGVHRATQCSVDYKSTNYAILQAKEYTWLV